MLSSLRNAISVVIIIASFVFCLRSPERNRQLMLGERRSGGEKYFNKTGEFDLHPLAEHGFTPEQCNLDGAEKFPSGTAQWQQKVPNFLVAGVAKSGTTTLTALLKAHPTVFGPTYKELNIFRHLPIEDDFTISVRKARRFLHQSGKFPVHSLMKHPHTLSFDGTPSYMFYSSTILPQVFCVCPWIKIIVILRDPIERLYSDFKYEIERGTIWRNSSLEHIVDKELQRFRLAGLNSTAQVASSEEEQLAWHRYQSLTRKGWLGKGVYDIQLRLLHKKMDEFGKKRSDLLVLTTKQLEHDLAGTYGRLLNFLELHHTALPFTQPRNQGTLKMPPMHPALRKRLEAFYGPYNARLRGLLDDPSMAFNTYVYENEYLPNSTGTAIL